MDNLSHSVTGLAAGELVHRLLPDEALPERQRLRHRLLLVSCWLASNFPDLDLVLTPLLPEPLGYLLHHRGHTHTVLYGMAQALLLWGLLWMLWPAARRLLKDSRHARNGLALALGAGLALHLLMDALNSYGIHPFHPFDSRWLYGDMVFILEPVFWIAFGVPLAMMVRRLWLRLPLLALLAGAPLYFTTQHYLPWGSLATLMLLAVALATLQRRAGMRGIAALLAAMMAVVAFVGMQAFASHSARSIVARHLQERDAASRMLDASMTSFPSNPLCWIFASVESNEDAGSYRLRRGIVSIAPQLLPAAACPRSLSGQAAQYDMAPDIVFLSEHEGSLATLRALSDANCHFNAWLRFARLPLLEQRRATDIRFASSPRGNFTTMHLDRFDGVACSPYIPRWDYPRADLLMPRKP